MTELVAVTGCTGNVGAAVVDSLAGAGIATRPLGRHTSPPLDFADPTTFRPACRGADMLFLVRPPAISRVGPTLNALIDVAIEEGVRHVVFLSVAGADTNRVVPHHRVERHLATATVDSTILRPGFFAQNLGDAYRTDIVEDARVVVPAGDGRVAFVDTRDIADVVARIAADPDPHVGRGYTLTGAEAVSFAEVATLLSDALGRTITYRPASVLGYMRHLAGRGLPFPQVLVQTVLHVGLRRGGAEVVDPTLAQLLGRPPRSLATYIQDHRERWTAA